MNYSEPLSNQIYRFVLALGFGIIMGVVYELFVGIRVIITEKKGAIIFQDLLFGAVFSVVSFFFMLVYNEGAVRLNLIVAQFAGLWVFHLTFGARFVCALRKFKKCFSFKRKKHKNL